MVRLARMELFSWDEIAVVHVINRTVRRCFLMGNDPLTGKNYDHRKAWMEQELVHLAKYFGIDLFCYAIMSNHFHLVLRSRPDVVAQWDDTEIARRWLMLCPKRRDANRQPEEPNKFELNSIRNDPERIKKIRTRLSDISWWMRFLCQKIGQKANREDKEVGKFWQSRFRAVRLLDETAILACAAYVDLNPIRAAIAETIEDSEFTSAQQRAQELQASLASDEHVLQGDAKEKERMISTDTAAKLVSPKPIAKSLCPLKLDEFKSEMGACCHVNGHRASEKGFLPMSVASYLELLDWTARQAREDKPGATPASAKPIFDRLGISPEVWCELVKDFGRLFSAVAGKPIVIESTRSRKRNQRYRIRSRAAELLLSS
jgi:REP element-mobilizing transposase RayT